MGPGNPVASSSLAVPEIDRHGGDRKEAAEAQQNKMCQEKCHCVILLPGNTQSIGPFEERIV